MESKMGLDPQSHIKGLTIHSLSKGSYAVFQEDNIKEEAQKSPNLRAHLLNLNEDSKSSIAKI